ncbi:hypothetical protein PR202_ga03608 [Eleusine coracana subsp. coracana]|uniref:Alpha/beta hydrolase fold-3 domain-containing protein n=1 Tax=Eleusine coracana subsp. coracana TaxID=191504 RepID=A0AAV5BNV5_ELECO|nr:hypothetical protein PR202_ga03608 [Eleusine coracana subsp. coracana]
MKTNSPLNLKAKAKKQQTRKRKKANKPHPPTAAELAPHLLPTIHGTTATDLRPATAILFGRGRRRPCPPSLYSSKASSSSFAFAAPPLLPRRLPARRHPPSASPPAPPTTAPRRPPNPSFSPDGVATKNIHPNPLSSLQIRLFLPNPHHSALAAGTVPHAPPALRRNSFPAPDHASASPPRGQQDPPLSRRASASFSGASTQAPQRACYGGAANDAFCRRVARLCDAIVVAVGYRLAPESRYPAAFEDGVAGLRWIAKQAILAACGRSRTTDKGAGADTFGAAMVEPWLAAHADPSRCVLLGVSCRANIADYVARKAVDAGKLLDPVRIVTQLGPSGCESSPSWKRISIEAYASNLTVVAELDWMKDRAIAYSEELRKVNVDAPVLEYKDAVHEFVTLDVMMKTPQAQACTEDIAIWVKKYISLRGHELSY